MKTATLKTTKLQFALLFSIFLLFSLGCSKSEDDAPPPGDGVIEESNGISADEIDSYKGDLGLLFNIRDVVKKGHKPEKVNITTTATEGDYNQEILIDQSTDFAKLSIAIDDLSESAEAELRNGVGITIEVLDVFNNTLTTENYSVITFEENGNQIDIDASSLPYVVQDLHFKDNLRYYLQPVDANGNYNNEIVWKPSSALDNSTRLEARNSSFNAGTTSEQYHIYKFSNSANEFALYSSNTNRYLRIGASTRTFRQSGAYSYPSTAPTSLGADLRFIINKESNGLYTINGSADNKPLRRFTDSGDVNWHTNNSGSVQYFRIVALDIDWETDALNTTHLQPIFPPAETSFGFNSTLKNCGSGTLEQQVGIERQVETTYTSALSETVGLSSRVTSSLDVSVSATAEASFFGNGGSVTGEVSAGLEISTEVSSSTTVSSEESVSNTNTFFSNRTVTVPAGSASLVYDAYQTYSNVRVPYVKRLRLKGKQTNNNEALSGQEIATQLYMGNFKGVITNISSDFVEITIRGNMYLDNIVDTQTEVKDVAANCN